MIQHGFIVGCVSDEDWGFLLKGWKAYAYLAVMLSPLALVGKMVHTMFKRIHTPNFLLRLNLEGIALLAVAYFGLHVIQAIENSAQHAC